MVVHRARIGRAKEETVVTLATTWLQVPIRSSVREFFRITTGKGIETKGRMMSGGKLCAQKRGEEEVESAKAKGRTGTYPSRERREKTLILLLGSLVKMNG